MINNRWLLKKQNKLLTIKFIRHQNLFIIDSFLISLILINLYYFSTYIYQAKIFASSKFLKDNNIYVPYINGVKFLKKKKKRKLLFVLHYSIFFKLFRAEKRDERSQSLICRHFLPFPSYMNKHLINTYFLSARLEDGRIRFDDFLKNPFRLTGWRTGFHFWLELLLMPIGGRYRQWILNCDET